MAGAVSLGDWGSVCTRGLTLVITINFCQRRSRRREEKGVGYGRVPHAWCDPEKNVFYLWFVRRFCRKESCGNKGLYTNFVRGEDAGRKCVISGHVPHAWCDPGKAHFICGLQGGFYNKGLYLRQVLYAPKYAMLGFLFFFVPCIFIKLTAKRAQLLWDRVFRWNWWL